MSQRFSTRLAAFTSIVAGIAGFLTLFVLILALAPRAEAFVYWADYPQNPGPTIGRANLDGSGPDRRFISSPTFSPTEWVAVDAEHVYWAEDFHRIARANLDGTGVEPSFIADAGQPAGVAVDAAHIYWADQINGTISRANLDGTGIEPNFITGAGYAYGVAVDTAHIYWADQSNGTIGRANLDGTGVEPGFISGAGFPSGVAVDAVHVYWASTRLVIPGPAGTIGRANLDGTDVEPGFISGPGSPCGVAVDAAHIYWKHGLKVGRANLDGTGVDKRFIAGRVGGGGCGVAVDALRSFSFGKAKKTTRSGKPRLALKRWTARVKLQLPAPGKLQLAPTKTVKGAKKRAGAKGTVELPVRPRGKAKHRLKTGSRCLHFLPRFRCSPNGIVGVDVEAEVTYTPRSGDPDIVASTLTEVARLVRRCRGC